MQRAMSVTEFLALPESKPGLEFIDGQVVQKPVTNADHIRIVWRIAAAFQDYAEKHGGGGGPEGSVEFATHPDAADVLLPDFAFWEEGAEMGVYPLSPPTVAVEVRSPSQSMKSQREKCEFYIAHGVAEAWLFDPEAESVEVFIDARPVERLTIGAMLRSQVLPEFQIPLERVFR